MAQALFALGLDSSQVQAVVAALQDLFPFRRARPGDQLRLERRAGDRGLHRFTYRQGPADEWIVRAAEGGALRGEKRAVDLRTEVARVAVSLQGSLYETLQAAGEDPLLAVEAADVLAWDVDFYQDVRAGDRLKVLVEKVWADGRFLRYGEVLAAEYDGATTGRKRLFRYTDPEGQTELLRRRRQQRPARASSSLPSSTPTSPPASATASTRCSATCGRTRAWTTARRRARRCGRSATASWSRPGWNGGCGKSVTLRHRERLRDGVLPPLERDGGRRRARLAEAGGGAASAAPASPPDRTCTTR